MPSSCTKTSLKAKHSIKDRLYWNFLNLIPLLIGSIAIARDSLKWALFYVGLAFLFLLINQLIFARMHCIHNVRNTGCVNCPVLPELLQIFKNISGSYIPFEKWLAFLAALFIFLFPAYWLVMDSLLLGAYVISWALFFLTLRRYECTRCVNFDCHMNGVPVEKRKNFHKKGFGQSIEESSKENFKKNIKMYSDLSGEDLWVSCDDRFVFLKMKHEFKDFLYWNFVTLTLLLSAGFAIGIHSIGWLIAYVLVVFFHFNILEQRFFCTHCPYFPRDGNKLKCMMNWGWPKHFKPRPHPPGKFDLAITTLGFLIVIFFPIPWLLKEPFFLGAYSVSILVFLLTIWKHECSHCIYFGCPFNRVAAEVRREFEGSRKTK